MMTKVYGNLSYKHAKPKNVNSMVAIQPSGNHKPPDSIKIHFDFKEGPNSVHVIYQKVNVASLCAVLNLPKGFQVMFFNS